MEPKFHILSELKSQAKALQDTHDHMSRTQALEAVAKSLGYRNWNTCRAKTLPWGVGTTATGTYLGQPFTGTVLQLKRGGEGFDITIEFDRPVDVVHSKGFSNWRSRVSSTIQGSGRSLAKTSDGSPHMILR